MRTNRLTIVSLIILIGASISCEPDRSDVFQKVEDHFEYENSHFRAYLRAIEYDGEFYPGQVYQLEIKGDQENWLLQRTAISEEDSTLRVVNTVHYAPTFSKPQMETQSPENIDSIVEFENSFESNTTVSRRIGQVDSHPEMEIQIEYMFMKDEPYFICESTMTMREEALYRLVRNDEMTVDSVFTHLIFNDDGVVKQMELYGGGLDELEQNPMSDQAEWLAFFNNEEGFGLGCVRIEYTNLRADGTESTLTKPYTKISKGAEGGRYWNRMLVYGGETLLQEGDRYHEKNAYVVLIGTKDEVISKLESLQQELTRIKNQQ